MKMLLATTPQRGRKLRGAGMNASTTGGGLTESPLRAECTASFQIDVTEARRMDMRPDKDCSDRARDSAEQMRLPRDAGLARENAPENGAVEDTDHQCRAQRDQ